MRLIAIIVIGFTLLGAYLMSVISNIPGFQPFKVLNVIGIAYDILGVLLLSQLVMSREDVQKDVVVIFERIAYAFIQGILLGAFTFCIFAGVFFSEGQRSESLNTMSLYLSPILLGTMLVVGVHTLGLDQDSGLSPKKKVTTMGVFFLGVGLVLQLLGAVIDLANGA